MERLSKKQWLDHGLLNLQESGFTSLKADKLAKSLGVSRGSFYWHFKDLADFHAGVLGRWQELKIQATIDGLEAGGDSAESKLRQLIGIASTGDGKLEQAIRAWAFSDAQVKATVDTIDARALGYVQFCLVEMGINDETAHARARIIYSAYLGQMMIGGDWPEEERSAQGEELMRFAGTME